MGEPGDVLGRGRLLDPVELVAFEPADAELDDENEVAAPVPVAFAEAFDCKKMDCNLSGVVWNVGSASRITWYWLSCVYMVLIWR